MIQAGTIRRLTWLASHLILPVVAIAMTVWYGPSVARVIHTHADFASISQSQSSRPLTSRQIGDAELMAVEPVRQTPRQLIRRPAALTTTPTQESTPNAASSRPDSVTLTTAPENSLTAAVLDQVSHSPAPATQLNSPTSPQPLTLREQHPEYREFNGRLIRPARTITMVTTAYSPDERSCGIHADGITASGKSVWTNGMKMVAADTRLLPFGSIVSIPGYYNDQPVPVLDRGGAIKGHRLDLLYPTHEIALKWGRQRQQITVWEYVN